jgi:hypothetical protein
VIDLVDVGTILTVLSYGDYYALKEEKIQAGWIVTLAVLVNCLNQLTWNIGSLFIKQSIKPPDYLL